MDPERTRLQRISELAGISTAEGRQQRRDDADRGVAADRFVVTYRLAIAGLIVSALSALIAAAGLVVAVSRDPQPVNVPAPVVTVVQVPAPAPAPPALPR